MKRESLIRKSGGEMRRAFAALAGILAIPACVMAQTLPCMPPSNSSTNIDGPWDQSGLYPAGTIQTVTYYSSVYGANEQMMVYTPPGYGTSQKYGVIYCYQGISTGIDTIFDDWCVDAGIVADNLIGQGKIKPVIIVAVNDQINGDPTSDTINCAIPYIDSHYSTYADADHRGLYGYSWGGMYCANIGCSHLDTFHHLSPSSPAFFSSGQGPNLFPNGGAEAKQKLKCMLLSCGTSDWDGFYPASLDLANWCISNGIPNFYWFPVQGGGHDAGVWRPAMWNFLQLADQAGISRSVSGATFYQDYNYGGSSATLAAGTYTMSQLSSAGVPNDWASSVKIPAGYTVIMYQDDNFSGTSWTLTSDTSSFGSLSPSANDQMSSCKIINGVANGTYKLIARHSGKAMDAYGAQTANGTQIIQWTYGGGSNQKWTLTDTSSGKYKIIGVQSGKALDIYGWQTGNGAKVELWDYTGGNNQLFSFTATDSGYYRITPQHATGSCLDVNGVSTADGAVVQLWQWLSGSNQQWAPQTP